MVGKEYLNNIYGSRGKKEYNSNIKVKKVIQNYDFLIITIIKQFTAIPQHSA